MKISELSRRSGVPLPSIKFYLREGLLPAGRVQGNQADYDDEHLRRLQLVRVLRETGGLSIGAIRRITETLDHPTGDPLEVLGQAVDALSDRQAEHSPVGEPEHARADADVGRFLAALGWDARPDAAAREDLVRALVTLREQYDPGLDVESYRAYAEAAQQLASHEVHWIADRLRAGPTEALEAVVRGTVLWEPVFLALRRLAHEDLTRKLQGACAPEPPAAD